MTEPARLVAFLGAVHGFGARVLREDFSGSGALARAWAASSPTRRSIAVDMDPAPLARAVAGRRVQGLVCEAGRCREKADIIAATNFPIGYQHTRESLLRYLRAARASLAARGVFVCDLYGGRDAFMPGKIVQFVRAPGSKRRPAGVWRGELVEYTFEQREADAVRGRVLDALHFRAWRSGKRGRTPDVVLTDAFVYDWRLWSLSELREAMIEAGFRTVEVHDRVGDAIDNEGNLLVRAIENGRELDANWVVYVVGRR